jgi:hypothetical protein
MLARYCGAEHQRADWTEHKKFCKRQERQAALLSKKR